MPFFDAEVTRKSETDEADACGACAHDQCMCPCTVCRAHVNRLGVEKCQCVSCVRHREDALRFAPGEEPA